MAVRKVKWSTKAIGQRQLITEWYAEHVGRLAAVHFNRDVESLVAMLSAMPTAGRIAPRFSSNKYTYYSFVLHSKYLVIYRFTSKVVYIQALRSTQML
ncbi:MAG: type II toxin-antitoxin system RelE/ParE family toxin [Bacteroidaceae bacterium]|nr:type II toxin-antitoxin system RelE/ParE family toxin [Bacteroidaceae bacterium]